MKEMYENLKVQFKSYVAGVDLYSALGGLVVGFIVGVII